MLNKENSTDKERKGFTKFICWGVFGVCILLVIIQVADYCRLTRLEKEAKRIEEEYWNLWFEPSDDEKVKKAVEAWNKEGIVSFFERDDIDEEMAEFQEICFYYENDSIFLNGDEWMFIDHFEGMREYNYKEILDATLFL